MKKLIYDKSLIILLVFTLILSICPLNYKSYALAKETGTNKKAYLTFDDGNSPITHEILDILKKYNVKATFFVLAKNAEKEALTRIVNEGHGLGSHGYSHKYDIYKNTDTLLEDLSKANDVFLKAVGFEPILFRPPYGERKKLSHEVRKEIALKDKNYVYAYWNGDSKDALISNISPEDIIKYSIYYIEKNPKEIVLLFHDGFGKENTAKALPTIIEYLLDRNYEIKKLDEHTHIKSVTYRGLDKSFIENLSRLDKIKE